MIEIVPTTEMDAIFAETFGAALPRHGFEKVDRRKWVRSTKQPIRELVQINALKGARFCPAWGFSLDYVPHVSGASLRWHRSAKTAILDLCYDPMDYEMKLNEWSIPSLEGRRIARQEAERQTKMTLDLALPWFDTVIGDVDLVREFEAKKQRPFVRFGFYNYVQGPLAYAVVLARVGRFKDAEAEMGKYCEDGRVREAIKIKLFQLLGKQAHQAGQDSGDRSSRAEPNANP
jgi:hypothetical protein